jgi:hypothetical protein
MNCRKQLLMQGADNFSQPVESSSLFFAEAGDSQSRMV